jgi:hypothetical protein
LAGLLAVGAASAMAQDSTSIAPPPAGRLTPRIGERVRFQLRDDPRRGLRADCEGTLVALAADTLVLEGATSSLRACARQTYRPPEIERVRVVRGDHGSRFGHAALGLVIGSAAGAALGRLAAGDGCVSSPCDDGDFAVGIITFGGAVTGGVVGTLIGVAIPAGPEWVRIPLGGPVRVAGMTFTPTAHVGLARR